MPAPQNKTTNVHKRNYWRIDTTYSKSASSTGAESYPASHSALRECEMIVTENQNDSSSTAGWGAARPFAG